MGGYRGLWGVVEATGGRGRALGALEAIGGYREQWGGGALGPQRCVGAHGVAV